MAWTKIGNLYTATETHAASSKATPVDADEIPLADSAASWALKKLTWANAKSAIAAATMTLTKKTLDTPIFSGYNTGTRPSASTSGAGAQIYDTVLHKALWSDGGKWRTGAHKADLLSGNYYWCNSAGNSASNLTGGFGAERLTPWVVDVPVAITNLIAEITNAGSAGTTVKLCIYNDDGTGRPGSLLLDAGTIDGATVAVQATSAFALTVQPGLYWVGGVPQGSGTQPGVRGVGAGIIDCDWGVPLGTSLPAAGANVYGFQKTGVTGVLPDPFGSTTITTAAIRVGIKVA